MMNVNLYNAANEGRVRDVTQLLRAGADVNFAEPTLGDTALTISSENGHLGVAAALIKADAEVNKARNDGATALMLASQNNRKEAVKVLLDAGAEVHKTTSTGNTALIAASLMGRAAVARMLLGGPIRQPGGRLRRLPRCCLCRRASRKGKKWGERSAGPHWTWC